MYSILISCRMVQWSSGPFKKLSGQWTITIFTYSREKGMFFVILIVVDLGMCSDIRYTWIRYEHGPFIRDPQPLWILVWTLNRNTLKNVWTGWFDLIYISVISNRQELIQKLMKEAKVGKHGLQTWKIFPHWPIMRYSFSSTRISARQNIDCSNVFIDDNFSNLAFFNVPN